MWMQRTDAGTEAIELVSTSTVALEDLPGAISATEPRYSFFKYEHTHESVVQAPLIFISSCPSGLKVKERMLHAASRAMFLNTVRTELGLEVEKRVCRVRLLLLHAKCWIAGSFGSLRDHHGCGARGVPPKDRDQDGVCAAEASGTQVGFGSDRYKEFNRSCLCPHFAYRTCFPIRLDLLSLCLCLDEGHAW